MLNHQYQFRCTLRFLLTAAQGPGYSSPDFTSRGLSRTTPVLGTSAWRIVQVLLSINPEIALRANSGYMIHRAKKLLARLRNLPLGRRPKLAMAMCVRDEAELLAANLLYHRALGVERAYVFLDRCTDGSEQIAASMPWVRAIRLDPADTERFEYVPDLHRVCFDRALELAREEGYQWLLILDADEFAFGDNAPAEPAGQTSALLRGNLPAMLSRVDRHTQQVRLRPKEVVPAALGEQAPFWQQHFFQDSCGFEREILDPVSGEVRKWSGLLAHPWGKSIVRTSADIQSFGSHRWVTNQGRFLPQRPASSPLEQEEHGFHYHFVFTTRKHWREKYRKLAHEPEVWYFGGPVEYTKQCWKRAVTSLNDKDLTADFERWVASRRSKLERLSRSGVLHKERFVEQVLVESGALREGRILLREADTGSAEFWKMPPFQLDQPPEAWRHVCNTTGSVTFTPAEMPRHAVLGFALPEYCEGKVFCWAEPTAELHVDLPAGDYCMTLDAGPMQSLWGGQMNVRLDHKPVPHRAAEGTVADSVQLRSEDFGDRFPHVLQLSFPPIDTSAWPAPDPRQLGAPVFAVRFRPLALGKASAA